MIVLESDIKKKLNYVLLQSIKNCGRQMEVDNKMLTN